MIARPTQAVIVLLVFLGGLALVGLGVWNRAVTSREGTFVAAADRALAAGRSYRLRQDSLRAVAWAAETKAAAAKASAESRDAEVVSLHAALGAAQSATDSLPVYQQLVATLEGQVADWQVAYGLLESAARTDRARADSAESRAGLLEPLVAEGRDLVDCHLLGIGFLPRCPSRTVSLVLGVGVGAVGMAALR